MSRADEIRKRIAKRKRTREKMVKGPNHRLFLADEQEKHGFDRYPSYEGEPDEGHPLFNKELFLLKILTSACLVLIIAIIFRNDSESFEPVKGLVMRAMEEDFQFTAVSEWYENQFGKPLALLPLDHTETEGDENGVQEYALPAAARILEDFGENGQKITIETVQGAEVTTMSEGRVRYIGKEEGFGKTVIIQHADKSETWYGNLETIDVALYEFVKKGSPVGTASDAGDGTTGTFYFAIKKGDDFIDPIQVIQFD